MVHVVLSERGWQQPSKEGCLATALGTHQYGYAFVAVQQVHLAPMSHSRANPYTEKIQLFGGDAGNPAEQASHVVLAVPLRQLVQIRVDGIIASHILRVYILHNHLFGAVF